MKNGTFAPLHIILKNLTFQRCPKALVWSKGLVAHSTAYSSGELKYRSFFVIHVD